MARASRFLTRSYARRCSARAARFRGAPSRNTGLSLASLRRRRARPGAEKRISGSAPSINGMAGQGYSEISLQQRGQEPARLQVPAFLLPAAVCVWLQSPKRRKSLRIRCDFLLVVTNRVFVKTLGYGKNVSELKRLMFIYEMHFLFFTGKTRENAGKTGWHAACYILGQGSKKRQGQRKEETRCWIMNAWNARRATSAAIL